MLIINLNFPYWTLSHGMLECYSISWSFVWCIVLEFGSDILNSSRLSNSSLLHGMKILGRSQIGSNSFCTNISTQRFYIDGKFIEWTVFIVLILLAHDTLDPGVFDTKVFGHYHTHTMKNILRMIIWNVRN